MGLTFPRTHAGGVPPLADRLRHLITTYGGDARAWQADLDAIDELERGGDQKRAHARFTDLRDRITDAGLQTRLDALRARGWLTGVPNVRDLADLTDRQLNRELTRLESAARHAQHLEDALAQARALHATLDARTVDADFTRFASVRLDELADVVGAADALRRRIAREANLEQRWRDARSRAAKASPVRVHVPDVSRASVPDPDEVARVLDEVESRLRDAERVNDLHARVHRTLRDPAVRDFTRERRKRLLRRADGAAGLADDAEKAVEALESVLVDAQALAREAAELASQAARARKRGQAGPEKERRSGDLQDFYG